MVWNKTVLSFTIFKYIWVYWSTNRLWDWTLSSTSASVLCESTVSPVYLCSSSRLMCDAEIASVNISVCGLLWVFECCFVCKLSVVAGQKLESAGVIVDTFPFHNKDKLKELSKAWYSGNQLSQPLGWWMQTRCHVIVCMHSHAENTIDVCMSALSRFNQWLFWKLCGFLLQLPWFLHLVSAPTCNIGPVHHILLR